MEKALLEEHVRYGEARFRDKELVRPFVNRIYQDLAELEEAMQPKTCVGCKYVSQGRYRVPCYTCARILHDEYEPKDNA